MIVLSGRNIVTLASIAVCLFVGTILCAISGTKICYSANITVCALAGTSRCCLESSVIFPPEDRPMCAFAETSSCVVVGTGMCSISGTTKLFSANTTMCAPAGTSRCTLEGSVICPPEDRTMCAFAETSRCVFVSTIICVVTGTTMYFLILFLSRPHYSLNINIGTRGFFNDMRKQEPAAYIRNTVESPASKKFKTTLQNEMRGRGVLVKEVNYDFEETNQPNIELPFIVVCNNSSRIEADIESSLKTIKGIICSRIIFVVLHVVGKNTLPKIYTKDLQGAQVCFENMNIDTIIDMAFSTEDGIYKCEMNQRAFKELSEVFELKTMSIVIRFLKGIMRRLHVRN